MASTWNWDRELVLVTGGSGGIGALVAKNFASKGIKVVILDLHPPKEESGILHNPLVHFYPCDVTSSSALTTTAQAIYASQGHPTILINNAGIGFGGTILSEPEADIRTTFDVNMISHFLLAKQFLPAMIEANHGHVVTVASMASFVTIAQNVDYSCTKAGALAFHEGLRQELRWRYGAEGVKTSIIHPHWVRTAMIAHLESDVGFSERVLLPEDVASAIVRQVMGGNSGQVMLPSWMAIVKGIKGWPGWLQERIRDSQKGIMAHVEEEGIGGRTKASEVENRKNV